MQEPAERLLKTIQKHEFMRAGDRVAAAVSGGADSVALLLLLIELRPELGIVLSIAHVNHKLRDTESDEDERFAAKLAATHGLEFVKHTAPVGRGQGAGIESAARQTRYEFFRALAREGRAAKIATAHTLDDQAETVLLRMFRGTGIRGLAGILPRLPLEEEGRVCGEVVRPMLAFRRAELREYLRSRRQDWREDSSNKDVTFLRNRLRQRLLPLIAEEFGEAAIEHLAELAEIARAEEEQWSVSTTARLTPSPRAPAVDVSQLLALPLAAARRTVQAWIRTNAPEASISFRLIEEILDLARSGPGKKLELPGQAAGADAARATASPTTARPRIFLPLAAPRIVRRSRKELALETPADHAGNYEYELIVPGEISVPELGVRITAAAVDVGDVPEQNRPELLDPAQLGKRVVIRNWRSGDRYWPPHTKSEKKVKDLLSDQHATGAGKKLWPVIACQGELVWMRGFAVPKEWHTHSGKAIWIREITAG